MVVGKSIDDRYVDMIRGAGDDIDVHTAVDEKEQEKLLSECDVLVTYHLPIDISKAPRLKWVHFMWEGVDSFSDSEMMRSDVVLTNSSGVHSVPIAEHIVLYMLALKRKAKMYMDLQERREWLGWWDQPSTGVLKGSTVGIIGYGRIGRAAAKILDGFGVRVLAVKRDPDRVEHEGFDGWDCCDMRGEVPQEMIGMDSLDRVLSGSDFLILSLPLTGETHHIIGKGELELMKEGAYLINIGRGGLVDENALVEALEKGRIGGAALDVFEEEPLDESSPLWGMDNVLITPHSSTAGDPADELVFTLFTENLKRFLRGEELLNVVDKKLGY